MKRNSHGGRRKGAGRKSKQKPSRFAYRIASSRLRLPGLLLLLGFTKKEVYRRKNDPDPSLSLRKPDRRNEWALREIYHKAYDRYKQRAKQVHPDVGGNNEAMTLLNAIWNRIEHLLKLRGLEL